MIALFFLSLLLLVAGICAAFLWRAVYGSLAIGLAAILCLVSGLRSVGEAEVGEVRVRMFAPELPSGELVALNGEKGKQVDVLNQGWHWINPLTKEVSMNKAVDIPPGSVGVVTALVGRQLPNGLNFAPEWPSLALLDARKFLSSEACGFRGPQLSVLPPGRYTYNSAVFRIAPQPALLVNAGEVAVIKDNTGRIFAGQAEQINGNLLVPRGHSGIWNEALPPGTYYLNQSALNPIKVKTTQRVYAYQRRAANDDDSIGVRSKDGFTMAVEVRPIVVVKPENAPRLVALHGNPDAVAQNDQEGDQLEVLESQAILPVVRAEVRNIGESITALEMVNKRVEKERELRERLKGRIESGYVTMVDFALANVDLTITEAGQRLLATQTDKKIADEQVATYAQQKTAEDARKALVEAKTIADTQAQLTQASLSVQINEQRGQALVKMANFEKEAFGRIVEVFGPDNAARLEMIKLAGEKGVVITPQVFMGGDNPTAALAGALLAPRRTEPAK